MLFAVVFVIPVYADDDSSGLTRGPNFEGQTVGPNWMAQWGACSEYQYSLNADDPNFGFYLVEDFVNIGDDESIEASHNLLNWGPIVHPTSGWGGFTDYLRTVWGPGGIDDTDAFLTMTLPEGPEGYTYSSVLSIRHLDGFANDNFDVFVDGELVYSHVDVFNNETWVTTEINVSDFINVPGEYEIKLNAKGPAWQWQATYGQVAIDWIRLVAYKDCLSN